MGVTHSFGTDLREELEAVAWERGWDTNEFLAFYAVSDHFEDAVRQFEEFTIECADGFNSVSEWYFDSFIEEQEWVETARENGCVIDERVVDTVTVEMNYQVVHLIDDDTVHTYVIYQ